jgi:SpoVK/Ycf46/Vps4 family AAA+-type ATPase
VALVSSPWNPGSEATFRGGTDLLREMMVIGATNCPQMAGETMLRQRKLHTIIDVASLSPATSKDIRDRIV